MLETCRRAQFGVVGAPYGWPSRSAAVRVARFTIGATVFQCIERMFTNVI
ncbi:MAG: hypothetical protein ACRELX_02790 [Longimicrobiales bacterium]